MIQKVRIYTLQKVKLFFNKVSENLFEIMSIKEESFGKVQITTFHSK